jgi:predicted RNA-binding Zn-ribbon protein involved in translation (DUF1610 family)
VEEVSPEVMGVEMDADLSAWGNAQRRVGSILALAVAAVLLVAALAVYFLMGEDGAIVYWTLVALVALALLFEVLLLVLRPRAADAAGAAWTPEPQTDTQPKSEPEPQWAPPPEVPSGLPVRTLTLRCSDCGTVFDVADTGERPLRHVCPGCGAEGTLRDEAAGPAPAAPSAPPTPLAMAIPVKRLKLRCGGCKEVFTIEDTGERPLRRACPYCGRTGEVR